MESTDIAVIGGGPAGASFARLAGKQYQVTVLDRRTLCALPSGVGKCCGGLLSPDAQRSLASLGLNLPLGVLVDPQIFAVRTMDLHVEAERYYQRPYVNMDRERFDRLADLSPSAPCPDAGSSRLPGGPHRRKGFPYHLSPGRRKPYAARWNRGGRGRRKLPGPPPVFSGYRHPAICRGTGMVRGRRTVPLLRRPFRPGTHRLLRLADLQKSAAGSWGRPSPGRTPPGVSIC